MRDLETYTIALVEPFDLNLARDQAREALQLGRRVVVTATRFGECRHAFTATPLADGSVHVESSAEGLTGRRATIRRAVNDGFAAVTRPFRPASTSELVPTGRRR